MSANDLQSTLDRLKSKGITFRLEDGKLKGQGNIALATKDELQVIKANRETLCLLLEIESTRCGETDAEDDREESNSVNSAVPVPPIPPNEILARIAEHNRANSETRAEWAIKRRDKSLVEVSLGVFRDRAEVERETQKQTNKWLYDTRGRTEFSASMRSLLEDCGLWGS